MEQHKRSSKNALKRSKPNKYDIEIHNQLVRTGCVELEHMWLTSLVRANHVEVESREGEARVVVGLA
ncbi:hypothetical protein L195_g050479 [Trifolium pratense]|uniref:Uncharacterized protein n=1 Tax=Trifolium pratense TaxID=57577 RepID=A0A2K3JU64_TRIPR|nr:hypothetical protein L195_g050479 [Trifolium pratense]